MSSDKQVSPPEMKKLTLLKLKLKSSLRHAQKIIASILSISMTAGALLYISIKAPEIHNVLLRAKVSDRVYMIKAALTGGGGTGFAVKGGKTGESYIVTNAHVCEHVLEKTEDGSVLVVDQDGSYMKRRVLEVSDSSDLCLIEGKPGVSGLSLGSELGLGEIVTVIGHPRLQPLTVSYGEIRGKMDTTILDHFMKTGDEFSDMLTRATDETCDKPKNQIIEDKIESPFGEIKLKACLDVTKAAYMSTAIIYPGNSGSPVVDFWGNVIGVAFASDDTNWGLIVSIDDLRHLLSRY